MACILEIYLTSLYLVKFSPLSNSFLLYLRDSLMIRQHALLLQDTKGLTSIHFLNNQLTYKVKFTIYLY